MTNVATPTISSHIYCNRFLFAILFYLCFLLACSQHQQKLVDAEKLKRSALAGEASAQLLFGDMYANGDGVPKDLKVALKWYQLAAKQGNAKAQTTMGLAYHLGTFNEDPKLPPTPTRFNLVPQDYKEAAKWYRLAAEQRYLPAELHLAAMYNSGQGVPQNNKESLKWYRLAAEQGDVVAQRTLGEMYYKGLRVRQDFQEASKWFQIAAEQGDVTVQYELGVMYEKGQGVKRDYELAHMWLNLAAANGHQQAAILREHIRPMMTLGQIDRAQTLADNWKPKNEVHARPLR